MSNFIDNLIYKVTGRIFLYKDYPILITTNINKIKLEDKYSNIIMLYMNEIYIYSNFYSNNQICKKI